MEAAAALTEGARPVQGLLEAAVGRAGNSRAGTDRAGRGINGRANGTD
jgi:hypothetical protein